MALKNQLNQVNHVNGYTNGTVGHRNTTKWDVRSSQTANNTFNPIRALVDEMDIRPNPEKKVITLSLGDPTVFGNFQPAEQVLQSVVDAIKNGKNNGYSPSFGHATARDAVAAYVSVQGPEVNGGDVYLASGCSDAINMAISVLADPEDNILIPRPGFSLYETLSLSQGIHVKHYDCLPEKSWEVDLEHLESLIDRKTKAIVVVNPSNPCGSNFNAEHIRAILEVAENNKVPILADEIYADLVFHDKSFHSFSSLSSSVPILSCGGIGKKFLVPGWRMGWVVVHDRNEIFGSEIRTGLVKLSQRILGPCTLIQAALPGILSTPEACHQETIAKLEKNADLLYEKLRIIPGLKPIKPEAAMYMMVGFDRNHLPEFKDEVAFTERLMCEQSVFCLPSKCFKYSNYFRIVLTVPEDQTEEACKRLEEFCLKHYKP
ncbi:tyrosine aminotransferase-like [Clavelina lepadiformis]|uniref:Tyrosine aminotransferase n=1 Tax=Clavelina lepadiformis TaxID=159417 RepID=A0ABP0F3F4_CLALP